MDGKASLIRRRNKENCDLRYKVTMFQAVSRARSAPTTIKYAGMAELADALDSGSDTLVKALTTCYKSRFGDLTPCKN